jgi:hypothetical protein
METLEVDVAIEAGAEFADDPLAGAIVDVACAEEDEEDEAGAKAKEDSYEIGPKAKLRLLWRLQFRRTKRKAGPSLRSK